MEELLEIDLTKNNDSEELVNQVITELDNKNSKTGAVKLRLGMTQISQSQMIYIKSLIESYGNKLTFIETSNDEVRNICQEIGIKTTNPSFESFTVKKNDLSEFKFEYEKNEENAYDTQRQVIGVYKKADENQNENNEEEEVDFYATKTDDPVVADTKNTLYINQTLRNGQTVDYDGNILIIGDCHPGSEIKATGDITVWGVLGSIAHAGIKGNKDAKIRALKMNAVQLRIADCYSRRPDGGNIPYINTSSEYTPEEARIVDDSIVLFNMAQK